MELERDLVGQILVGKLEVIRKLGDGGMGEVYEVEHRLTGHRRALKVVRPEFADRPRFMKRLLREARVAGTLGSEHVVETYDAGRLEDGSAYVLMELLHGQSLYEAMQADGPIAPRRLVGIMSQVAQGMAAAHRAGIVHRDLKPENIFLLEEEEGFERVKILDFGVSKFESILEEAPSRLTTEGTLVGTPYYMSPEQSAGRPVDKRSDVYAMGVMMYEALTGRLPFDASSVSELFMKIGAGQCAPLLTRAPELDPRWGELVHKAFHRVPEERFEDAESLREALLPLEDGPRQSVAPLSSGVRSTLDYSEPAPQQEHPREAETLIGIRNPTAADTAPPASPPEAEAPDGSSAPARAQKLPPTSPERPAAKARIPDRKARRPAPVPAKPAEPRTERGPRVWPWVLAGVAALGVLVLRWAWTGTQPAPVPPAPPPVAAAPERAPDEAPARPAPPAADAVPAPDPTTPAAPVVEDPTPAPTAPPEPARRRDPRPRPEPDRATRVGLDPNPYR